MTNVSDLFGLNENVQTRLITASTTWRRPNTSKIIRYNALLIGGGGPGGQVASAFLMPGGGGSGEINKLFNALMTDDLVITIGAAGAIGNNGGATIIDVGGPNELTALGGQPGKSGDDGGNGGPGAYGGAGGAGIGSSDGGPGADGTYRPGAGGPAGPTALEGGPPGKAGLLGGASYGQPTQNGWPNSGPTGSIAAGGNPIIDFPMLLDFGAGGPGDGLGNNGAIWLQYWFE